MRGLVIWTEEGADFIPWSSLRKISLRYCTEEEVNDLGVGSEVERFYLELHYNSPVQFLEDGSPVYFEEREIDELAFDSYAEFLERAGFEDPVEEAGQREGLNVLNLDRAA